MAKSANLYARIEPEVKEQAEAILSALGIPASNAITMFCLLYTSHNLQHPEDKKEPLTQDAVELLTSPFELAGYKEAIMEAMYKGTKRNIESEMDSKNAQVG